MPDGFVQAISTSAATVFSLGLAFLGLWAWGPKADANWKPIHLLVVALAVASFALLGAVPWVVTNVVAEATRAADLANALKCARTFYAAGTGLLVLCVIVSMAISYVTNE